MSQKRKTPKKQSVPFLKRTSDRISEAGQSPALWFSLVGAIDAGLIILSVVLYLRVRSLFVLFGGILILVAVDLWALNRLSVKAGKKKEALASEFVHAFSYFLIYVQNGLPVYKAFEETVAYCGSELGRLVTKLLRDIDEDKSVIPYLSFAEEIGSLEIRQVILAIHKLNDEGGGEHCIREFNAIFASLKESDVRRKANALDERIKSLSALPLIGSALTMGILASAIVIVLGGSINGF